MTRTTLARVVGLGLGGAALLAACGGGGGDPGGSVNLDDVATAAANGTLIASDASTALDSGVLTAQAVIAAQAGVAAVGPDRSAALAAGRNGQAALAAVLINVPVVCTGGGTATVSLSGGTPAGLLNGQFDSGEVYAVAFTDCRSASGAAIVNGGLGLTVLAATATSTTLQITATQLAVALPRGTVTINGSLTRRISTTGGSGGSTTVASHDTATSLNVGTQFNARSGSFTLSALDITRQATWLAGVPQGSSLSGTHTLSATLPGGSFSHTVATQGSVSYGANGLPVSGAWALTLPGVFVGVTVATPVVTITIDEGRDGTIDRSFTIPVGRLQADAG